MRLRVSFPPNPRPPYWREIAELRVESGKSLDARVPAFLLDSAISRLGALWGTAVGACWGALWSRGRVERREGLLVFRGMPRHTFPRGGVCVGSCFLTGDGPLPHALLRHEAVHAAQWRRYGLLMPVLYLLAGRDPLRNRFEIEAGLTAGGYVRG